MNGVSALFLGLLILQLILLVRIDLRERRIPNGLNLAIGITGLAYHLIISPHLTTLALYAALACVTLLVLWGTSLLIRKLNARAVVGLGDVKFLTAAAFWVGMDGSFLVLLIACLALLAGEIALSPWRGLRWNAPRPFGPMLAFGMITVIAFAMLNHHGV